MFTISLAFLQLYLLYEDYFSLQLALGLLKLLRQEFDLLTHRLVTDLVRTRQLLRCCLVIHCCVLDILPILSGCGVLEEFEAVTQLDDE